MSTTMPVDDLGSMENPSKSEDFTWLGNELVMAGETPILSGRLGTPERLAGASEHVFGYDEFGVPDIANMSEETKIHGVTGELPLGFAGYMRDDISDTLFAQAREYMPEIGRFMGRDILKGRVEQPRSLNEYACCHNDPVGFVDLNGMDPMKISNKIKDIIDDDEKKNELFNAGMKYNAENIATNKFNKIMQKPINDWQTQRLGIIEKDFDTPLRIAKTRSQNLRLGRAANGAKKLEELEMKKSAQISSTNKLANTSKGAAKYGPAVALATVDVGIKYKKDYDDGLSSSKRNTNLLVNGGFAGAGLLVGVCISSNPVGWGVGFFIVGLDVLFGNQIKNWINSLE